MNNDEEVLNFFKALVDVDRLKMVGMLAVESLSAENIADYLHMQPRTVTRQLEYLRAFGLVKLEGRTYNLDVRALQELARRQLAGEKRHLSADDFEGEDYDRKVLSDFSLPDGRFKSIPAQHKKMMVLLHFMVGSFEPGERYPEKQVNEIIRRYYDDPASLRRAMVDNKLLSRQNGEYWRVEETP